MQVTQIEWVREKRMVIACNTCRLLNHWKSSECWIENLSLLQRLKRRESCAKSLNCLFSHRTAGVNFDLGSLAMTPLLLCSVILKFLSPSLIHSLNFSCEFYLLSSLRKFMMKCLLHFFLLFFSVVIGRHILWDNTLILRKKTRSLSLR